MTTHLVDDGRWIVLLGIRRNTLPFVKNDLPLRGDALALFGLGDRRDEFGTPTRIDDFLGRLAGLVELPMLRRPRVRRVYDRMLEEWVRHVRHL